MKFIKNLIFIIYIFFTIAGLSFAESLFSDILDLKEVYFPIEQRLGVISKHMARFSLSLELENNKDYPELVKKIDQIKKSLAEYLLNTSAEDLSDNQSLSRIKQDAIEIINQVTSPYRIKTIFMNDILIQ